MTRNDEEFDYVIVGAGSAGCVLADKLSADGASKVLVLEAGPMDRNLFIHIPAGHHAIYKGPKLNWNYETVPEESLFDRKIEQPRGKVIGGSSSINAMVYMRGHPLDYDGWAADFGLEEWDYAHCLPYFKAAETSNRGASEWRGGSGPLHVTRGTTPNPLYDALLEAGTQSGQGTSDDLNGYQPEGTARFDRTTTPDGRRCSAATAYLKPALQRSNLTLKTSALARNVIVSGNRAAGVAYEHRGKIRTAHAAKEVILSGGAINSPQLLMLSGIGPADHLREMGIDVALDLPGVGQNLHDHPEVGLKYACTKPVTPHHLQTLLGKASVGMQWMAFGSGLGASNMYEGGGLVRSSAKAAYPDIQYHFCPVGVGFDSRGNIKLDQGFHIHQDLMRPTSRGELCLRSADPNDKPSLRFNYLQTEEDRRVLVDGLLRGREVVAQRAFDHLRGEEIYPGKDVTGYADLERYIRSTMDTVFHPCGSCRMGSDEMAVVDAELRVHGIEGLRVADASVMPRVVSGNTNAPTQMLAGRAADYILGRPRLAPFHAHFSFQEKSAA
ncbi:choline dehydrogenase [Methyloligella sp. 2.7D]|uniref:choline dehydrogenase n=1 Tax=unclassified Methyloligella TaxID=2625955 RepID=UPI00157BF834|nr:choline dehydrogenase [Methyloligella sp. GL2]QKP76663.1 choline dehydrogenase [Methyloligella sp. GL2]